MTTALEIGPLLSEVLQAQHNDEEATTYPLVESYCAELERSFRRAGASVLWPVGPAAERLAGAAVLYSKGRIRLHGWSSSLNGEHVLLLAVSAVTPLALVRAAERAKALGALQVDACGVAVQGADRDEVRQSIGRYLPLDAGRSRRRDGDDRVAFESAVA